MSTKSESYGYHKIKKPGTEKEPGWVKIIKYYLE